MNIIDTMRDPNLFAPFFRNLASWSAWIVLLKVMFALPMDETEVELYRRLTGRQAPPTRQVREFWGIIGRRGGKSRIAALVAVFLACFRSYSDVLAPGERGTVMVLAADRKQARTVLRYIVAFLKGVPMLAALIIRETAEGVDLSNGITIEVHTASFRTARGYTIVAAILDEIAFWRSEDAANPDAEIVTAIRPAMATVPGALLLGISSPYARRGVLWEMYQAYFGKEDEEILVCQADTRSMNPSVGEAFIARAYEEDEAAASAEYGAQFRSDIEGFLTREAVEAVVIPGRYELPPSFEFAYSAFVDPSGGSADSFTLGIAHEERDGRRVLDMLRERKAPFSPDEVVAEFAADLKRYGCLTIIGDRYSAQFVVDAFRKHGIEYQPSDRTKSELYLELLPRINSGRVQLLDNGTLRSQLVRLERRTSRSGKDSVDHPPGGCRDDIANAAAGAINYAQPAPVMAGPAQEYAEYEYDVMSPWSGEEGERR